MLIAYIILHIIGGFISYRFNLAHLQNSDIGGAHYYYTKDVIATMAYGSILGVIGLLIAILIGNTKSGFKLY